MPLRCIYERGGDKELNGAKADKPWPKPPPSSLVNKIEWPLNDLPKTMVMVRWTVAGSAEYTNLNIYAWI